MKNNTVSKDFCIMNFGSELSLLKMIADQNKLTLRKESDELEAKDILNRSIKQN